MYYREYIPSKPLRQYIDCYWEHRLDAAAGAAPVEQRCLPLGTAEIIVQVSESVSHYYKKNEQWQKSERVFITGMFQHTAIWKAAPGSILFGIRLKPEAFIELFQVPAAYLFNQLEDAAAVFGKFAKACETQMTGLTSIESLIAVAEKLLFKRLGDLNIKRNAVVDTCRLIREAQQPLSLDQICHQLYISPRTLERSFKTQFGSGPKLYQRIIRFSRAYAQIQSNKHINLSWTDICYEQGYTDQAYFIKEFKTFAGTSPAAFSRQAQAFEPMLLSAV